MRLQGVGVEVAVSECEQHSTATAPTCHTALHLTCTVDISIIATTTNTGHARNMKGRDIWIVRSYQNPSAEYWGYTGLAPVTSRTLREKTV
jgi:hypothetical protein